MRRHAEARHQLSGSTSSRASPTPRQYAWSEIEVPAVGSRRHERDGGPAKTPRFDRNPSARGDCRREITQCAVSASTFMVSNATAGVTREARHRMMRRFTEEVVPMVERAKVPDAPTFPARAAE